LDRLGCRHLFAGDHHRRKEEEMSRTTKHKIEIKPMELSPEQVAGLLRARAKGNLQLTINVVIEGVSSGVNGNQVDLGLMIQEELTLNKLIKGEP
jgi:hypothetical protein